MRIARGSGPGALYGASAPAETFETIEESIINQSDIEEISDANSARAAEVERYSHMPGFGGGSRENPSRV